MMPVTLYSAANMSQRSNLNKFHNCKQLSSLEIENSLQSVCSWVERNNYKGYDPGDGLTSFLRPLTFGNQFAERILQQCVWKAPVNVRKYIGIAPLDSTKGRGFMAWGYLLRYCAAGHSSDLDRAIKCLEWLDIMRVPGQVGHCWGNHFDFTTRSGRMPAHTPTIVWTGLIGQAFLLAYEKTSEKRFLNVAESICEWILHLPKEVTHLGNCISYTGITQNSVHNSNLLGAAMLANTWFHTRNDEYQRVARQAVLYSCARQHSNGSWWYGEEKKYHWVDNFHTAYNLDSIMRYMQSTGDNSFLANLTLGHNYFKYTFFDKNGRPRYYHNKAYPIDIQCAAQAIDTFCLFAELDSESLELAIRVASWTIENMQDSSGFFYYRKYSFITAKTPYFHWGQATMFKALAHLMSLVNAR